MTTTFAQTANLVLYNGQSAQPLHAGQKQQIKAKAKAKAKVKADEHYRILKRQTG